uniref:Putative LAGLIDADG endonuclease/maturase n=1 Tax=Ophiostoma ips TaxID=5163 RepID=A6XKD1_9PEZI|nr:putative LAGLIDADG endonuclease/maturase [Ophiostoma ips]
MENKNFIEWFSGFVDAEGCFHIKSKTMSNGNKRYYFEFVIKLHIDNVLLVKFIHETLGIGRIAIRSNSNSCTFEVGSEKDLRILIDLLDKCPLIGAKVLDFLSFKKAFFFYFDRPGLVTDEIIDAIEKIRNNHNTRRTDFKLPLDFKSSITDYKLLGLFEGDGSFVIQTQSLTPKFEIELTEVQKLLLNEIQKYLINYFLGLGLSLEQLEKAIKIQDLKAKGNSKATVRLTITGIDFLNNYFNVYLKKLQFFSDKSKDFEIFCTICESLFNKAHINNKEVKNSLLNLAKGMNNARYSTAKNLDE